jgi:long-chain acyl-CoA synthetase
MALSDAVRRARERQPAKPALIVGERRWSYEQFDEITDRIGAALLRRGLQPGDRVALHVANSAEIVFGYYACFKIGAAAVPLNIRLKGPELEYVINHCDARFYLGQAELFSEIQAVRARLESVEEYYLAGDADAFPQTRPFAELMAQPAGEISFPGVPDDAIAAILYTSGSTARPKGVTHSHATAERLAAICNAAAQLHGEQIFGCFVPLVHMSGFGLQMLPAVSLGATLLVIPRFEPEAVLQSLQQHRAQVIVGLPVIYNDLVNCPGAAGYDLEALEICLAGGDAVPTELQRRFREQFGVELTELHGMTEVCPCFANPVQGPKKTGSIGLPAPGTSARLVDDAGRDVPPGEVGEILVRSEATTVGYWADPEATAAALQEGWLRTGDLARRDEDGYYWFVGRKKQIIIRGGSNISPLEVEEALCQHPAVREAGVVGVPDPTWGETVQAYVALKEGEEASEAELRGFVKERIAAYKVPEAILFLAELPKGLTGKIDRRTLRERAAPAAQAAASRQAQAA